MSEKPKVAVCLWFDGQAEAAANFYTSLLPNSKITNESRPAEGEPALMVTFTLGGTPFQALNGGSQFTHSEAASISVSTKDQEETDRLWEILTSDGGKENRCGWLQDRFGVSWQIVPEVLSDYIGSSDVEASERAMNALFAMNKIVIAELEAAYRG